MEGRELTARVWEKGSRGHREMGPRQRKVAGQKGANGRAPQGNSGRRCKYEHRAWTYMRTPPVRAGIQGVLPTLQPVSRMHHVDPLHDTHHSFNYVYFI